MERTARFLSPVEVIGEVKGRRRWPDELKARISAEACEPGARVASVAWRAIFAQTVCRTGVAWRGNFI
ncbi:MAG: transposase [Chloroflexi bacterium]|nr:transposase [Chloroflexota bacterium]